MRDENKKDNTLSILSTNCQKEADKYHFSRTYAYFIFYRKNTTLVIVFTLKTYVTFKFLIETPKHISIYQLKEMNFRLKSQI